MLNHTRAAIIGLALLASAGPLLANAEKAKAPAMLPTCAKPDWPQASLQNGEQGSVTLAFRIESDGSVSDSKIVTSSGFPALDMAARDGISRCMFKPATVEGKRDAAWMKVQYVWTLEDPSPEQWRLAKEGAARGEPLAQFDLANLIVRATGQKRDMAEVTRLFKLAADQNHPAALFKLGMLHLSGDVSGAADLAVGAQLLGKAAALGDARAQYMIAMFALNSAALPTRDAAIALLRKSHGQKYSASTSVLGRLLVDRGTTPEEIAEGLTLLRAAAEQNDGDALFALGRLSETGARVPQDLAQAAAYYEKAVVMGSRQAPDALSKLRGRKAP